MRRSLLPLTVLLLVGCHAPGGVETAEPVAEVTAPEIKVDTLLFPSSTVSLKGQRGKVVLLDFWATWCGPCRAITPTLEKIYADHKAQGLEAMAITHEDREVVARTERRLPHAMPVYLDSDGGAHKAFGASSLPTIVVVDRQGHIAYRTAGFGDGTVAALTAAVKKALRSG